MIWQKIANFFFKHLQIDGFSLQETKEHWTSALLPQKFFDKNSRILSMCPCFSTYTHLNIYNLVMYLRIDGYFRCPGIHIYTDRDRQLYNTQGVWNVVNPSSESRIDTENSIYGFKYEWVKIATVWHKSYTKRKYDLNITVRETDSMRVSTIVFYSPVWLQDILFILLWF